MSYSGLYPLDQDKLVWQNVPHKTTLTPPPHPRPHKKERKKTTHGPHMRIKPGFKFNVFSRHLQQTKGAFNQETNEGWGGGGGVQGRGSVCTVNHSVSMFLTP